MEELKSVSYRQAKEADILDIISILVKYISNHEYYTSINRLKSMLQNTFIAEYNNNIIGASAIGRLGDTIVGEDSHNIDYEIAYIAVDEQYRGIGIATELIKLCIESMQTNTVIACEAVGFLIPHRANAASALENNGFRLYKTLHSYYKNNKQLSDGCKLCAMNKSTLCNNCSAYLYIRY